MKIQSKEDINSPWDIKQVSGTINLDERNMLVDALDGAEWPLDTMEAVICGTLESEGLLKSVSDGKWDITAKGKKLIKFILSKNKEISELSVSQI